MILVGINGTEMIHKNFLSSDTTALHLGKSWVGLVLIKTRRSVRLFLVKTAISGFEQAHVGGGIGTLPAGGAA